MLLYDMYGNPVNVDPRVVNQQQNFNPQQMMPNNCQCDNRFMWIQGKEAAKAYPVAPDRTVFFLDDNDSYAYLKKTDRDGRTSMFKTYQLVEEPEEDANPMNANYISKEEFGRFSNDINSTLNNLMAKLDSMGQNNQIYNQKPQQYNNQRKQVRNDA